MNKDNKIVIYWAMGLITLVIVCLLFLLFKMEGII